MSGYRNSAQIFTIGLNELGQRVDNYLFKSLKCIPKSKIYSLLRKGGIRVNGKHVEHIYRLKINDIIEVSSLWYSNKNGNFVKHFNNTFIILLQQSILYEDKDLLIINKPSGIAVHGGTKIFNNVLDGLRFLYSYDVFLELVHRIDRDTSGLLLLAKNRYSLCCLHKQFRNYQIKKKYLALVYGIWPMDLKIVNIPVICKKIYKNSIKNKPLFINIKCSETHFSVKRYFKFSTLIKAELITGKTHQIRLHTSYLGHYIAFDKRYGKFEFDNRLSHTGLKRLFLHAYELNFIHPRTNKTILIRSPLDKDLKTCLDNL
ncbi:RluA family pseudouridine synthase [Candidatus Purcelliella pentastirinorum]|uniref:RluA family pseudouridine synthase n=1 Tax=Candidatus Purcelliella pentastirinorum TaxID=472834 RepID=UPI00237ABF0C|nr:RluA family pseudouridine synthase [Candidatus Purcelliella pentastirinorum]WDR80595.1 RluA family pseudouridine synthase [Candidatus Purcelliella pentastirinorum]